MVGIRRRSRVSVSKRGAEQRKQRQRNADKQHQRRQQRQYDDAERGVGDAPVSAEDNREPAGQRQDGAGQYDGNHQSIQ